KEKGLIPYINSSIKNHIFLIEYETDYKKYHCQLEVSKSTFDAFNKKDLINILYIIDKPAKCTLPNSVNLNYLLSLSLMIIGFLFMFLTVGFVYYIYTSFKKPPIGKPVKLTSNLELQNRQLTCPECGKLMSEGYLPTVGGVSWRYIDEPIGIPTILSGLPGTTFWIKRPKLHGYHCNECKVITFKYGTNKI
ncbi:MAG: hypothetical protein GTO02_03860, partial [Candidatus Dadabacteria bacterium]|nr:hypothetical protein [Candidatus Dadabacteria bacterium]NIQ13561.1 hypothetical protein [Candidatus Dadabacteria bacterium]